ncbi:MAG: hypothetical protein ACI8RN_003043 [Glaciecola sp.]|jgi:hypothetical protein
MAHDFAPSLLAGLLLLTRQLPARECIHSALAKAALSAALGFVVTGMTCNQQFLCRHNAHSGEDRA